MAQNIAKMKVVTKKRLALVVEELRLRKKIIVTTNGVFDILHAGHVRYLSKARSLGDALIVAVNSDSSVKRLKGQGRPINKAKDRAEVVASLESVDYAVIFSDADPRRILKIIMPDIHVKGGDYVLDKIIERDVVLKRGGKIKIVDAYQGYSTTSIIERIFESQNKIRNSR